MTTIIGSIENGAYVYRVPEEGIKVAVPFRDVARRMRVQGTVIGGVNIGAEIGETELCYLDSLGNPEVSGKWWRKIKRRAKKAVRKVVKVAKKVAKSRVVRSLYKAAKMAAPSPYKEYIAAGETAVRFGKLVSQKTRKGRRALKALPTIKALARGKISLPRAKLRAKRFGLKPNTIRDAAIFLRMKKSAKPTARRALKAISNIENTAKAPQRIVSARSGRKYAVTVKAA